MTTVYRYTRNKDPLSSMISKNQIFYNEDFPKFCSCGKYIRYSESKKIWMEVQIDGVTILKENHTCRYITSTEGDLVEV